MATLDPADRAQDRIDRTIEIVSSCGDFCQVSDVRPGFIEPPS
jgi:hypothetical protein